MTTVVTNLSSRDLIFLMEENFYPYKILKTMGNDLLNASEVTTCRKAVEIFPPPPKKKKKKMLKVLISYSGQIFNKNTLFFIMWDCFNRKSALCYLKVLLGSNFYEFD